MGNKEYYLSAINPIFILFVGILGLFFGLEDGIFKNSNNQDAEITFDKSVILLFFLMISLSTILFYIIFTKLKSIGIRMIYGTILFIMQMIFVLEVSSLTNEANHLSNNQVLALLILIVGVISSILLFYIYVKPMVNLPLRNGGIIASSIISGRIIAISLDFQSLIFFSIMLSIFDVWSVFRGPLAKIMGKPRNLSNRNLSSINLNQDHLLENVTKIVHRGTPVYISKSLETIIGIGDLLFYSILLYTSIAMFGLIGIIISMISILLGIILTFFLLKRISPLPGLPIPVLLTISAMILLNLYF